MKTRGLLTIKSILAIALVCAASTVCQTAVADTVTVGNGFSNNIYPFGDSSYLGEYQQVYNSAAFGLNNPISITAITFFLDSFFSQGTGISGTYALNFSTTSASASSLSTTYANNIGLDNQLFTSGSVSNILTFTGAPFLYVPSKGNLLLDVRVLTPNSIPAVLQAGCSNDTNRIYGNGGTGAGNCSSFGLKTQFTFTPALTTVTAEPSSLLLISTGILALATACRRHLYSARRQHDI